MTPPRKVFISIAQLRSDCYGNQSRQPSRVRNRSTAVLIAHLTGSRHDSRLPSCCPVHPAVHCRLHYLTRENTVDTTYLCHSATVYWPRLTSDRHPQTYRSSTSSSSTITLTQKNATGDAKAPQNIHFNGPSRRDFRRKSETQSKRIPSPHVQSSKQQTFPPDP